MRVRSLTIAGSSPALWLGGCLLLAMVYVLTGWLGLSLAVVHESATTVWPPAGLSVAALLLFGLRYWPGVFVGALLVNLALNGVLAGALMVGVGNTLEVVLAVALLRRMPGFDRHLPRLSDLLSLIGFGVIFAPAISASLGTAAQWLTGSVNDASLRQIWYSWWLGDALSVLLIAPFILTWSRRGARLQGRRLQRFLVLLTLLFLMSAFLFLIGYRANVANYLISYAMLPVLLWIAIGVGFRETTLANLLVATMVIAGAALGGGFFAAESMTGELVLVHGYVMLTAGSSLLLASASQERRLALRESREMQRRLDAVIAHSNAFIYMRESESGRYILVNDHFAKAMGLGIEEVLGRDDQELLSPETAARFRSNDEAVMESGEPLSFEERFTTADGRELTLLSTRFPMRDDRGRLFATGGISTDISDRILMERALRQNERRYRTLFETAFDAILILDHGRIVDCNSRAAALLRRSQEVLRGREMADFLPDPQSMEDLLARPEVDGEIMVLETVIRPVEGMPVDVEALHQRALIDGEAVDYLILRDISKRKRAERLLRHRAHYDSLTDLPNRLFAFDRLRQAMEEAREQGSRVAVMFLDLDLFKKINDSLGHRVGDLLLVRVGERLSEALGSDGMVARLGGDEFLVVMGNVHDSEQVTRVATRLLDRVKQPYEVESHELVVSVSIGLTFFPDDGEDPENLLRNADAAMYLAKSRGRSTYAWFTRDLDDRGRRRLAVESYLRHAQRAGELHLEYQPEYDIFSNEIVAFEALLRWNSEGLGNVKPDEFIAVAEESGLISELGAWVIEEACREAAGWPERLGAAVRIAINLSPGQLRDGRAYDALKRSIERYRLDPRRIELEITESLLLNDSREVRQAVDRLLDLGTTLTLDDFGTGYSSISYLRLLPFKKLKLDRSFVAAIEPDGEGGRLCRSIMALANSFGLKVVGEGVETAEQLDFLRRHGAHLYQGFLASPPLPADRLASLFPDHSQDLA